MPMQVFSHDIEKAISVRGTHASKNNQMEIYDQKVEGYFKLTPTGNKDDSTTIVISNDVIAFSDFDLAATMQKLATLHNQNNSERATVSSVKPCVI